MAAPTWREISAPQMSTRDLGLAGASIADAFRNMGQVFIDRENRLRSDTTNEAMANILANQDRNAVLNLAGLDPRVDKAALARAFNDHVTGLVTRGKDQEELAGMEALAKYGSLANDYRAGLMDGSFKGTWADFGRLRGIADGDQAFGRVGASLTDVDDIINNRTDNIRERDSLNETIRYNNIQAADAAAGRRLQAQSLAMQRERFNAEMRAQRERDQLEKFGAQHRDAAGRMARSFITNGVGVEDAWSRYTQMLARDRAEPGGGKKRFGSDFTPEQLGALKNEFVAAYGAQAYSNPENFNTQATPNKSWSLGHLTDAINTAQQGIASDVQRNQRQDRLDNPAYWAVKDIEEAGDKLGKISQQELRDLYDSKIGWGNVNPFFITGSDVLKNYDPRVAEHVLRNMDFRFAGANDAKRLKDTLDEVQDAFSNKNDTLATGLERERAKYGPARKNARALVELQRRATLATQIQGSMPTAFQDEANALFNELKRKNQKKN